MIIKIMVQTPKGQAAKSEKRLKPFLLGHTKARNVYVNKSDNKIIWEIETDIKRAKKIMRNVNTFDIIIGGIFNHKLMKKVRKRLSPDDEAELKNMLLKQTDVKILKKAEEEELINGMTFWQRVTKTWRKL